MQAHNISAVSRSAYAHGRGIDAIPLSDSPVPLSVRGIVTPNILPLSHNVASSGISVFISPGTCLPMRYALSSLHHSRPHVFIGLYQ
jgi:hypothetical protein